MNENPYAPPTANVADVDGDRTRQRPKQITWAVWILWTSALVVLAPALVVIVLDRIDDGFFPLGLIALWICYFSIAFSVIRGISKGRNWARIALFVIYGVVISYEYMDARASRFGLHPFVVRMLLVLGTLHVCACALIFFGEGRKWFKREARKT